MEKMDCMVNKKEQWCLLMKKDDLATQKECLYLCQPPQQRKMPEQKEHIYNIILYEIKGLWTPQKCLKYELFGNRLVLQLSEIHTSSDFSFRSDNDCILYFVVTVSSSELLNQSTKTYKCRESFCSGFKFFIYEYD